MHFALSWELPRRFSCTQGWVCWWSCCISTPHQFSILLCCSVPWKIEPCRFITHALLGVARPLRREQKTGGERCGLFIPCSLPVPAPAPWSSCLPPWHPGEAGQPCLHISSFLWVPETLFSPFVPSLGKLRAPKLAYFLIPEHTA